MKKKTVPKVNQKTEDARLEKASKERALKEGIERERAIEASAEAKKKLIERQTFLNDLLNTLHAEGINSIGDLEVKLARANADVDAA